MATTKTQSAQKSSTASKTKTESKTATGKKGNSSKSLTTSNHDEIKAWVEKRGGTPATVKGTDKENAGILRIDFPGYSGKDTLEPIGWDEFFEKFDKSNLEFLYQEKTTTGKESRFSKFVSKN